MTTVRLVIDNAQVREAALISTEVRRLVAAKADAVAGAAAASGERIIVRDAGGRRARSYVIIDSPEGSIIESKTRVLGIALDAARG